MNLHALSRFAAINVLLAVSLAIAGSTRATAQATSGATTDGYRNCQQRAAAVVTLYSGAEIGSGSIIRPNGLIITNHHVVQESWQNPGKIKIYVKLADGRRYLGLAIAADPANDLALVRITPQTPLAAIVPLANPSQIHPGQAVCAIGNPFGISGVLSLGKVSDFRGSNDLKSAVFLSRGNSGGPLLNEQGEMIGVNKSIWLSDNGENTGTSFATNVQVVQAFIQRHEFQKLSFAALPPLESANTVPNLSTRPVSTGGILGAIIDRRNLTVRQIVIGSPADLSGLRPGDRLVAIDQKPLNNLTTLQKALQHRRNAVLTIVRDPSGRSDIAVSF